jgi:hypothetical protein
MASHLLTPKTRLVEVHRWSRDAHREATRRLADALILSYLVDVRPNALAKRDEAPLCEIGSLVSGVPDAERVYEPLLREVA